MNLNKIIKLMYIGMVFASCSIHSSIEFNKIPIIDKNIDTIKTIKYQYYLVKNFSDTKKNEQQIDSFAHCFDSQALKFQDYCVTFYKESKVTNIPYILKHRDEFDTYSQDHDMLYLYTWYNGKFLLRYKIRDSKPIDPKYNFKDIDK